MQTERIENVVLFRAHRDRETERVHVVASFRRRRIFFRRRGFVVERDIERILVAVIPKRIVGKL